MKISKRDQKLILVLLGLAVFLTTYLGICRPFNTKKADVEAQLAELQAQADTLNTYAANQTSYKDEMNRIGDELSAELSQYPGEIRSEDLIMYATELEDKIGIKVSNISVSSPEVLSKLSVPEKSGDSYSLVPVAALKIGLTLSCSMSYDQMKNLINYVNNNSGKAELADVTVNYSSTDGKLTGTVTINKYFLASANYSYSKTSIPPVQQGTNDPFGTVTTTASAPPSPSPTGTH